MQRTRRKKELCIDYMNVKNIEREREGERGGGIERGTPKKTHIVIINIHHLYLKMITLRVPTSFRTSATASVGDVGMGTSLLFAESLIHISICSALVGSAAADNNLRRIRTQVVVTEAVLVPTTPQRRGIRFLQILPVTVFVKSLHTKS